MRRREMPTGMLFSPPATAWQPAVRFWKRYPVRPNLSFLSCKTGAVPCTSRGWGGPRRTLLGYVLEGCLPVFQT